jgi:hypothetical protein
MPRYVSSPTYRSNSSEEDFQVEWLGKIIVRAKIESTNYVSHGVSRGQHKDWNGVLRGPRVLQDAEPIEPRQHHVQHHHIVMLARNEVAPLIASI